MDPEALEAALDAGGVGVSLHHPSGQDAHWTARMAELHGVSERSGRPEVLFRHVCPEDRRVIDEALAVAGRQPAPSTSEYRVDHPERGERWVSATVAPVEAGRPRHGASRGGGHDRLTLVATDITDRKHRDFSAGRRRAQIEGLHWVGRSIIAGRDLADTATALVEAAADVLGASIGVLVHAAPDHHGGALVLATSGIDPSTTTAPRPFHWPVAAGVAAGVSVVDDVASAEGVDDLLVAFGLPAPVVRPDTSALLVPVGPGASAGALCFLRVGVGYFSDDDVALAAAIGSTAATAIQHAQRNEQQRLAARTFQEHLLPPTEVELDGLDLCVQYHPGRDGLDVGGDWFDVIDLGDRIGLAVGDICGHGLEAAAHMGQLRHSFRALVRSSSSPEEALSVLNEIALELRTTATVAYVELDPVDGACTVWRCGHLPPVVSAHDGSVRWVGELGDGGTMLGFVDDVETCSIRTTLDRGDVLLLYTDGLIERRGEPIDESLERLVGALGDSRTMTVLDDRCGALYAALATVSPDADDIALVAVRRHRS